MTTKEKIIEILDKYSDDTGTFVKHSNWDKVADEILDLSNGMAKSKQHPSLFGNPHYPQWPILKSYEIAH